MYIALYRYFDIKNKSSSTPLKATASRCEWLQKMKLNEEWIATQSLAFNNFNADDFINKPVKIKIKYIKFI